MLPAVPSGTVDLSDSGLLVYVPSPISVILNYMDTHNRAGTVAGRRKELAAQEQTGASSRTRPKGRKARSRVRMGVYLYTHAARPATRQGMLTYVPMYTACKVLSSLEVVQGTPLYGFHAQPEVRAFIYMYIYIHNVCYGWGNG